MNQCGIFVFLLGIFPLLSGCATPAYQGHYHRGMTLLAQEDFEAAEAEFREAVRLRPAEGWTHYYLGAAISETGKGEGVTDEEYRKAEAAFREILRRKPEDAEAHLGLGLSLGVQDKNGDAEKEFREVVRLRPMDAIAYYNLGNALLNQGKYGEAEEAFSQSIRLRTNEAGPHSGRASALMQLGKLEEAEKELRFVVHLRPNDARVHTELRQVLIAQERSLEADLEQREFYRVSQRNADEYIGRGGELGKKGKSAEAKRQYEKAIQAFPEYPEGHYRLAAWYASSGKREEALKSLRDAVGFAFADWPLMEKDRDLESLREDPQFRDLAEVVKKRWEEKQRKGNLKAPEAIKP